MKHRRLVTLHTTGRYAGVARILGVETSPVPLTEGELCTPIECVMMGGRFRLAELVGTTERAVFYREVA